MPKTVTITCDGCDGDLTYTGNTVDYRLVLSAERKAHQNDDCAVTLMMIYPPVNRPHYFCGLGCLDAWRSTPAKERE